jgi:predicted transcriptional regulator
LKLRKPNEVNPPNERIKKILAVINENPGLGFRQLARSAKLSHFSLSYYIKKMEKEKLIKIYRESKHVGFYSHDMPDSDVFVINLLNKKTIRKILLQLIESPQSLSSLSNKLRKNPATISQGLQRIIKNEFAVKKIYDKGTTFEIKNKDRIVRTFKKYSISKTLCIPLILSISLFLYDLGEFML